MLAVRKKYLYHFSEKYPEFTYYHFDLELNNNIGEQALYYDLTNQYGYVTISGFKSGLKYFISCNIDIENDNNVKFQLKSGANTSSFYNINSSDKIFKGEITTDGNEIKLYVNATVIEGILGNRKGFINNIDLTTNIWNEIDIEPSEIKITNSIKQTQDLNKINTIYSNQFNIMLNKENLNALELHPDFIHNFNNERVLYDMRYNVSDLHFSGSLEVSEIYYNNGIGIAKVNIISDLYNFVHKLENKTLNQLDNLSSFTYTKEDFYNHIYYDSSYTSTNYKNKEYCYVLHDWGMNINKEFFYQYQDKAINRCYYNKRYEFDEKSKNYYLNENVSHDGLGTSYGEIFINAFTPALFVNYIFRKIHENAGISYDGDFLNTDDFQKLLILPYNFKNLDLDKERNEFKLTPILNSSDQDFWSISAGNSASTILHGLVDTDYDNGCISGQSIYNAQDGIYSGFKYEVTLFVQANTTNSAATNDYKGVLKLGYNEIGSEGNREFVYEEFGGTLIGETGKTLTFSGEITDIYIPNKQNSIVMSIDTFADSDNNVSVMFRNKGMLLHNVGMVQDKIAPTSNINLSKLLSNKSQLDFIKDIITMFNLYPVFEYNKVTYYTREEFFNSGEISTSKTENTNVINVLLPTNYVKKNYNFTFDQDNRGLIKNYNDSYNVSYGCKKIITGVENEDSQDFPVNGAIPYTQKVSLHTDVNIGRNAKQSSDRKTFSGYNKDNYYNDWELPNKDIYAMLEWNLYIYDTHYDILKIKDEVLWEPPNPCSGYPQDCDIIYNFNTATSTDLNFTYLYDYYEVEISNIISLSSNKIEISVYLSENDYSKFSLNNIIKYKNSFYIIEKISTWSPTQTVNMTLLKYVYNPYY